MGVNNDFINLQSYVYGHRFKQNQTIYEYILEFLLVTLAKKGISEKDKMDEFFPKVEDVNCGIKYYPTNNVGLKRFIFFERSKQEGRFKLDQIAYDYHIEVLKQIIEIESNKNNLNKDICINIIQDLLYGFSAVLENRSWFAQNLLPICPEVISAEIMGSKGKRSIDLKPHQYTDEGKEFGEIVDSLFETNRYNFMSRGGEVYYLHVLSAINHFPKYKQELEKGINSIVHQFKEFEKLCAIIQETWVKKAEILVSKDEDNRSSVSTEVCKTLGFIPKGFELREKYTVKELVNLLHSDMHPFEKIEVLSSGIILQIIVMCYLQSRVVCNKSVGYLIFDVNCYKGNSNDEVKKIAALNFQQYEQDILDALYKEVPIYKNKDKYNNEKSELDTIQDAIKDSIKVFKKIGKKIGIIRPINEKSTRFTLSETILKFIVTSIVKPNTKITFDSFLDKLYNHFSIVIAKEQYLKAEKNNKLRDISFLDQNKKDFHDMLKEGGFLRELSDFTSIVENPYLEV